MADPSTMSDKAMGEKLEEITQRGKTIMKEFQSRVTAGDMAQAEETNALEQLEKVARLLQPRPNKELMKNPDGFCKLTIEAIDKIKANPVGVTVANLFFLEWASSKEWACDFAAHVTPEVRTWVLEGPHKDLSGLHRVDRGSATVGMGVYFYLCLDAMMAYTGSGTNMEYRGGIRKRLVDRAYLKKSTAKTKFDKYLASNPNERVQIVQLMETRIRSPDDDPYAPMDEVPCVYHHTAKDLSQEELNRHRFLTVLGENIFMMLMCSMEDPARNLCHWKHRPWGGFNQQWALQSPVKDVTFPKFADRIYSTLRQAKIAARKALDPVGHLEALDKARIYMNEKNADLKANDPVGYRAARDAENARNAARKAADPAKHEATKEKKRAHVKKEMDPVGYQAERDAQNAKYAAKWEADPVGHEEKKRKEREDYAAKKESDPVWYQANLEAVKRRKRQKKIEKAAKANGSAVTDYFKPTKTETNPGTDLTTSKYFAKK